MSDFDDFCFEEKIENTKIGVSQEASLDELFGTSMSRKSKFSPIQDTIEEPIRRKYKESKKRKINEIQTGIEEIIFQQVQVKFYLI
jgi:hypothetical protein